MGNNTEMYAILTNGVRGFGINSNISGDGTEARSNECGIILRVT
jgi:hypothetical protein